MDMASVCYLFIHIAEALTIWVYCKKVFASKYSFSAELAGVFLCYLLIYLNFTFGKFETNLLFLLFFNFLYIYICYDTSFSSALLQSIIINITMASSEFGIIGMVSHYAPDFYNVQTDIRDLINLAILCKLLHFFLLLLISSWFTRSREKAQLSHKYSFFLFIMLFISGFIMVVLTAICADYKLSLQMDILIAVSSFLLLFLNIFLTWMYSYMQLKNLEFMEMQLLLQKEYDANQYYTALHEQDERQKILIHDIKKHLRSIAYLNQKEDIKGVETYLERMIESPELKEKIQVCDNDFLNTIIYRMQRICRENNISFHTDIRSGIMDFVSEYDMTALFDNLLENAIEACKDTSGAFIELSISPHKVEDIVIITSINSCKEDPFSKNKKLSSTKKDERYHGYGLKSINRIAKKYKGHSQFFYEEGDHTFHVVLTMRTT